jgi:hypothetical protein
MSGTGYFFPPVRRLCAKASGLLRDKTASWVLEQAAKVWLLRHQDGKK